MRILFVCVPRTGSTSFIKSLSKSLTIPYVSVPDSFTYKENSSLIESIIKKDNIIFRMSPNNYVGYSLIEFSSFFDKVILLSRLDDEDHYKSLVNLYYREHIMESGTKGLYVYEDIPKSSLNQIEKVINYKQIKDQKQEIEQLSSELKQEVLYYENIFYSNKVTEYLTSEFAEFNKEIYENSLAQTKKQRIVRKKILI